MAEVLVVFERLPRQEQEVLALCAEAGLVGVGVIAIDGTKVHANASRDRTMDDEQIARAIVDGLPDGAGEE